MATAAGASAAALPVRPGEKPWTEAELKKVRQQLQSDIAGLTADINEAESAIAAEVAGRDRGVVPVIEVPADPARLPDDRVHVEVPGEAPQGPV